MSHKNGFKINNLGQTIKKNKGFSLLNLLEDINGVENRVKNTSCSPMKTSVSSVEVTFLEESKSLYSTQSESTLFDTTSTCTGLITNILNSLNNGDGLISTTNVAKLAGNYNIFYVEPQCSNTSEDEFLKNSQVSNSCVNNKNTTLNKSQETVIIFDHSLDQNTNDEEKIKLNESPESNDQSLVHNKTTPLPSQIECLVECRSVQVEVNQNTKSVQLETKPSNVKSVHLKIHRDLDFTTVRTETKSNLNSTIILVETDGCQKKKPSSNHKVSSLEICARNRSCQTQCYIPLSLTSSSDHKSTFCKGLWSMFQSKKRQKSNEKVFTFFKFKDKNNLEQLNDKPQDRFQFSSVESQSVDKSFVDKSTNIIEKINKGTYSNLQTKSLQETELKDGYCQFSETPSTSSESKNNSELHNCLSKVKLRSISTQARQHSPHRISPLPSPRRSPHSHSFATPDDVSCDIHTCPFYSDPRPRDSHSKSPPKLLQSHSVDPSYRPEHLQHFVPEIVRKPSKRKLQNQCLASTENPCKHCTHLKESVNTVFQKLCDIATKTQGMCYSECPKNNSNKTWKNNSNNLKPRDFDTERDEKVLQVIPINIHQIRDFQKTSSSRYKPVLTSIQSSRAPKFKDKNYNNSNGYDGGVIYQRLNDPYIIKNQSPLYQHHYAEASNRKVTPINTCFINTCLLPKNDKPSVRIKKSFKKPNYQVYNTGPYGANVFNEDNASLTDNIVLKKNMLEEFIKLDESAKVTSGKRLGDYPGLSDHIKKLDKTLEVALLVPHLKQLMLNETTNKL